MSGGFEELAVEAALDAERQFVLTLGGFALELPGARLVTHEKIPAPRFNFVQELGVGPERQTAFFERALDHYFQRALRPTFRAEVPATAHVDRGLRRLGFVPRPSALVLFLQRPGAGAEAPKDAPAVRPARASEVEQVAAFWSDERERPELRTALDIAWHHPNPAERLVPLFAELDGAPVAAAVVYRYRAAVGVHFVATRPDARGRGAASALVAYAARERPAGEAAVLSLFLDAPRAAARLGRLGFDPARSFVEYELPRDAALAIPAPGPPGPPRWRPPR